MCVRVYQVISRLGRSDIRNGVIEVQSAKSTRELDEDGENLGEATLVGLTFKDAEFQFSLRISLFGVWRGGRRRTPECKPADRRVLRLRFQRFRWGPQRMPSRGLGRWLPGQANIWSRYSAVQYLELLVVWEDKQWWGGVAQPLALTSIFNLDRV